VTAGGRQGSFEGKVLKVAKSDIRYGMRGELFGAYYFDRIGGILPARNSAGEIIEYTHELPGGERPNRHAGGPFCEFKVNPTPDSPGVYVITVDDELKYIGRCESLRARFGPTNYGKISARNCHHDGQATNCKINALILSETKAGRVVTLWFCACADYAAIERDLIARFVPPWNGQKGGSIRRAVPAERRESVGAPVEHKRDKAASAEDFQAVLRQEFAEASARGDMCLRISAGKLHKRVGGYPGANHRMPVCCNVMRAMMRAGDVVVDAPPKGLGASLEIEYRLPRGGR
jgi:hypothetical protein